ncbi:MAG: 3'-5' exonuclease domain-containing protein 2 [Spirochaetia bacterium]|jgi:ribonuclease D|nr:3'-5' exonuclease domain-containing protein 2 [Spirochaetia bacterium]
MPSTELPSRLSREYINSLPLIRYSGSIEVIKDSPMLDDLLSRIPGETVTGFDTETKPVFKRGQSHPAALVQIALPETVLLIQLQPSGLPLSLIKFFERESVKKAGVGLKDDIQKLQNISPFTARGFIDLGDIAAKKGIIQTGVRALAARYLQGRISKAEQKSNWERKNLTDKQKSYAATDAWACAQIYPELLSDENDYHDDADLTNGFSEEQL